MVAMHSFLIWRLTTEMSRSYNQSLNNDNIAILPTFYCSKIIPTSPNHTLIFQSSVTLTYHHNETNTNFFYVKFIVGNMRVCQGCKGKLKYSNECVLASSLDLCAVRAQWCTFWDSNYILIRSQKEQSIHYYFNLSCVCAVAPTFVSYSLVVPVYVGPKLNLVHKEYLNLVCNVRWAFLFLHVAMFCWFRTLNLVTLIIFVVIYRFASNKVTMRSLTNYLKCNATYKRILRILQFAT